MAERHIPLRILAEPVLRPHTDLLCHMYKPSLELWRLPYAAKVSLPMLPKPG